MDPEERATRRPNAFVLYSTIFLSFGDELLLLRRGDERAFAPGRWTGLGGRVEPDETGDLAASALRELREEAGIEAGAVARFALRRALYHDRPGAPLTGLLYFTGELAARLEPACSEGTLHWKGPDEIAALDVIETTAAVIPRLVEDLARDPDGREPVRTGLAGFRRDGVLAGVRWAPG